MIPSLGLANLKIDLHVIKKLPVSDGLVVSKELFKTLFFEQDGGQILDLKDQHKLELGPTHLGLEATDNGHQIIMLAKFYRVNPEKKLELLDQKYLRFKIGVTTLFTDLKIANHSLELTVTPTYL